MIFQVRDPMPAVYFFLIDVSMNAIQTGATAAAADGGAGGRGPGRPHPARAGRAPGGVSSGVWFMLGR